jgi:hypothetical protein
LTIVVLAVNFLSIIFEEQKNNLAVYGIGYALPIVALAYFMKVRSIMTGNDKKNRTADSVEISEISEPTNFSSDRTD